MCNSRWTIQRPRYDEAPPRETEKGKPRAESPEEGEI
jgi:hypothetical protein